ncbi:MAG: zinc ribbon domain-containing protein [Gammaproteobacteria bacterium]|jgi:putative FmdB family regulatory protein
MPIYEYVCKDCGHEFDALQKLSDEPLKTCPACEKDSLKKKISAAGFRLSGSGWYETDFKSDRKKNLAQGDSSDKSASTGAAEGKTDKADSDKPKNSAGGGKEAVA